MTVYIDVVLIENLIMNYIIIFATGIILKIKMKQIRIILGSLIGAIYTIIAYVSNLRIYSNFILKFILSIIIVYVSFNPQTQKQLWKSLLIFYLTSLVFGGAAFAIIYVVRPQEILRNNQLIFGTTSMKIILFSAILAFIVIILAFKIVKNKISKKDMFCDIEVKIITNKPVVVIEHTLLYDCIPKQILNNIEQILGGDFTNVPEEIREEYISKLKFIPFSSLGKQNGMLIGINAKYIKIKSEENENINENVIVGIYNKSLTKRGEYRALIGIELV